MKDKTDITIILDRSGSMSSVKDDTIGGLIIFWRNSKKSKAKQFYRLFNSMTNTTLFIYKLSRQTDRRNLSAARNDRTFRCRRANNQFCREQACRIAGSRKTESSFVCYFDGWL